MVTAMLYTSIGIGIGYHWYRYRPISLGWILGAFLGIVLTLNTSTPVMFMNV